MVVVRERERPEDFGRGGRVFIGRMGEADLNHTARNGMSANECLRGRCLVESGKLTITGRFSVFDHKLLRTDVLGGSVCSLAER